MPSSTTPKPRRRTASVKAGASPIPSGMSSECGHDTCGSACRVKYVGPVSSLGDHHAFTASRGSTHAWSAAIITSLALVVTGTVAFQSVSASQTQRSETLSKQTANRSDIAELKDMITRLNARLDQVLSAKATKSSDGDMLKKIMPKEGSAVPANTLPTN